MLIAQWLERLTGDQKVAVRFRSGAQEYFLGLRKLE